MRIRLVGVSRAGLFGYLHHVAQIHAQVINVADVSLECGLGALFNLFRRDAQRRHDAGDITGVGPGQAGDLADDAIDRRENEDPYQIGADWHRQRVLQVVLGYRKDSFVNE